MSAEMISEVAAGAATGSDEGLRPARLIRPVTGVPADGTAATQVTDDAPAVERNLADRRVDWLSRHLRRVDPAAAENVAGAGPGVRAEARWQPALRTLGFSDPADYLRCRHAEQHWTVNAMSAELGVSRPALEAAMRRHGLAKVAHAAKRHAADQRAAEVAARLGYRSIAAYVARRRSDGLTWRALAAESGQPQTWLRRQAGIGGGSG